MIVGLCMRGDLGSASPNPTSHMLRCDGENGAPLGAKEVVSMCFTSERPRGLPRGETSQSRMTALCRSLILPARYHCCRQCHVHGTQELELDAGVYEDESG